MRYLLLAAAAIAFSAPALAQTTTLQEVTTRGITMSAGGMTITVDYKSDGSFTAMNGDVTGKWRIDGNKLCTSSNYDPVESCAAYPAGKKSGDTFDVTGKNGTGTITIK